MTRLFFHKVTILGVGLIGASFALSIKKNRLCEEIIGFGRNRENLIRAKGRGIIDSFELNPADACRGSDLILFATPVGTFLDIAKKILPSLKKGAIVTDVGSVKGNLVYDIEKIMPEGIHYISVHPITGSERSGIESSHGELFIDAKCILTPTENSDAGTVKIVSDLWKSLGSNVITMDPKKHDRIYASVSHLPHLIAYALVNTAAEIDNSYLEFCGQGFKDTTRIASSSPEMWRDICLLNKENLIEMISIFQKNLDTLSQYLRASDSESVHRELKKARTLREGIGQN
jgi:prephenate dehydrogenase